MNTKQAEFRDKALQELLEEKRKDYDVLRLLSFTPAIFEAYLTSAFQAGWWAKEDSEMY